MAFVFGDSLLRHLSYHLESDDITYNVYFQPGATILSLQTYIESQFSVEHTPDLVILQVGTNSLARCGLLTTFVRQYKSLIYTVKSLYPTAKIYISELLVRELFDVVIYNAALAQITKDCGCNLIRSGVTKEDLYDGLHLFEQGYEQLASDIKRSIDAGRKPRPIYPASMIPPIVRQKKKKKGDATDSNKLPCSNSLPSDTSYRKLPPKHRKRAVYDVFGGDGFKQLGWPMKTSTTSPVQTVTILPPATCTYVGQPSRPHTGTPASVSISAPSAYVQRKQKARRKKKKMKRLKRKRHKRRQKQVT